MRSAVLRFRIFGVEILATKARINRPPCLITVQDYAQQITLARAGLLVQGANGCSERSHMVRQISAPRPPDPYGAASIDQFLSFAK
jgi:hypothetical protein